MTVNTLVNPLNLNEAKQLIERLLRAAISRYGVDHVDLNLESIEDCEEPVLSIIYHSKHNSFGIESNLSTKNINFRNMDRLADQLNISFNDYDANFDWRTLY